MPNPAAGAQLSGVSAALAVGLLLYLVVAVPATSRRRHHRFLRQLAHDPDARLYRYRRTILTQWGVLALCVMIVAASPGLSLAQLGVAWPLLSGAAAPVTVVASIGLLLTVVVLVAVARQLDRRPRPRAVAGSESVIALLPRTVRERRAFTGLALTAGICEELCYRGFLIAVATAVAPEWGSARLVLASAVGFGLAHSYQGAAGVLLSALVGACLAVLYLGTGSLLLPICYHAVLDLRVLLLPTPEGRRSAGRHAARRHPRTGGHRARPHR